MRIVAAAATVLVLAAAAAAVAQPQQKGPAPKPATKAAPKAANAPAAKTAEPKAPEAKMESRTPALAELLRASPEGDWRGFDQSRLLYLEIPRSGRVIIELAPQFAPNTVTNIRALAKAGYFDRAAIVRVQDNFVVQWGVPDGAPLPSMGAAKAKISPPEFTRPARGLTFTALPDRDSYAPQVGFVDGFPAARDPKTGRAWMVHCYGTVAVGRDTAQDSGNGAELYAVLGQARHLDRNLTVVGRVVQGMELLSSLPRGPMPMGFYTESSQRVPLRVRIGSDLPAAQQVQLEALRTDSETFEAVAESRRNRRDDFYQVPAGGVDVCNIPLPVRPAAR